ncbi:ankyrin repeat-containing protein [Chrysochromulina tobinii]|uniref:Ankyrin repeat-containing protein n=1 Tax=Chrysochromulina tobinii TaxID=1460289 RepID=A0A0M0K273_9EUKA|nr:ankyrin repeat-containing protein [Chrysochromulina tobinii]|eukprot:KOO32702.1 ankyrin repeat-containing protein [Chrysochromulina sp. CCMP291]
MNVSARALVSEGIDHALLDAMRKINMAQPGLVAKQLHAELLKQDEQRWGHVTVGEVKRMYVKMAKAEVAEHAAEAGPFQHLMPSTSSMSRDLRTADEVARDLFADPISRDSERMKVSRPGLAARGTTLHKGDRLGTAAERGDTQQIIKLLKKGVDPNFQNAASGVTPLGVACERGHVGAIKALLDAKADPEVATKEGYRPLHIAVQFGKLDVVKLLCERRADVHAHCPHQDTLPLMLATNFNFVDVIKTLLAHKADPNCRSKQRGLTPLHFAFSARAVVALVAAHADVDAQDNKALKTALHAVAADGGSAEACVALLSCGASAIAADHRGERPTERALRTGGKVATQCAHAVIGYCELGTIIGNHARHLWNSNLSLLSIVDVAFLRRDMCVADKAKRLAMELGESTWTSPEMSSPEMSFHEIIDVAAAKLGLDQSTLGETLISKADACLVHLAALWLNPQNDATRVGGTVSLEEHLLARAALLPLEEILGAGAKKLSEMYEQAKSLPDDAKCEFGNSASKAAAAAGTPSHDAGHDGGTTRGLVRPMGLGEKVPAPPIHATEID